MNTRLQVEHPVTEAVTGIDIVREQIRIAAGLPLSFTQDDVVFEGHAIECRINAENPRTFTPSPGLVTDFHAPGGLGVRLDSALYTGYVIPPYYDSLAGKLIVHGRDRAECIARLKRSLGEMVVAGVETTIPLFQDLLRRARHPGGRLQHPLAGTVDQSDVEAPRGGVPCPPSPSTTCSTVTPAACFPWRTPARTTASSWSTPSARRAAAARLSYCPPSGAHSARGPV